MDGADGLHVEGAGHDRHRFGHRVGRGRNDGHPLTEALDVDPVRDLEDVRHVVADQDDRETAIAAGCAECLTKPYELDELIALVERYIGPAQAQKKIA